MRLTLAHSPDLDDAFMFHALLHGLVDTGEMQFEEVRADIQSLNEKAMLGEYEVSAASCYAYGRVSGRYVVSASGASVGDGYGPVMVAREGTLKRGFDCVIAVPGRNTTACLVTQLWAPEAAVVSLPFDKIVPAVAAGDVSAGVLIHEAQLTYGESELAKVVDLGEWWRAQTGLPLPLGCVVMRRDLPLAMRKTIARAIRESVRYALEHREQTLAACREWARGLSEEHASAFVGMYVNDFTLDLGDRGRRGLERLFDEAYGGGLLSQMPTIELVG